MSLEMNFYIQSDEDKYMEEDVDSILCLHWKNKHDLLNMLTAFGERIPQEDESVSVYHFNKDAIKQMIEYLMETLEILVSKSIDTINKMEDLEERTEEEASIEKQLRDFYVEGRKLIEVKDECWKRGTWNCFTLFDNFDNQGWQIFHLLYGMIGFLSRMKDNEVAILRF